MHRCVCGRPFAEQRFLRVHEKACAKVKERSMRILNVISHTSKDSGTSTKHQDHDDSEHAADLETAESARFMGKVKRKRKLFGTTSASSSTTRELQHLSRIGEGYSAAPVMVSTDIITPYPEVAHVCLPWQSSPQMHMQRSRQMP